MPQGLEKDFYFNAATWGKNMVEITNHIAYELLNTKFKRVFLDYVILSIDCDYKGMVTHKDAVIAAFRILHDRYDYSISIEPDKMTVSRPVKIRKTAFFSTSFPSNKLKYNALLW